MFYQLFTSGFLSTLEDGEAVMATAGQERGHLQLSDPAWALLSCPAGSPLVLGSHTLPHPDLAFSRQGSLVLESGQARG